MNGEFLLSGQEFCTHATHFVMHTNESVYHGQITTDTCLINCCHGDAV